MSANIHAIYLANPAAALISTDLFYIGRSPYSSSDDMGVPWSVIQAAFSVAFPWTTVTGASAALAINHGYVITHATAATITLPTTSAVGDKISIIGLGAYGGTQGLWIVAQNANQSIIFGQAVTTVGTGGSLASQTATDSLDLVCVVANLTWTVRGPVCGELTVT